RRQNARAPATVNKGSSGLGMKVYSKDAIGLKVGPTAVLFMSLIFIAFVIILHIWGKYTR
ncbi:hypothetical protein DICPUDRAFT_36820, partial [Dictyostelium purpureum]